MISSLMISQPLSVGCRTGLRRKFFFVTDRMCTKPPPSDSCGYLIATEKTGDKLICVLEAL
jgi:hypothetical protein